MSPAYLKSTCFNPIFLFKLCSPPPCPTLHHTARLLKESCHLGFHCPTSHSLLSLLQTSEPSYQGLSEFCATKPKGPFSVFTCLSGLSMTSQEEGEDGHREGDHHCLLDHASFSQWSALWAMSSFLKEFLLKLEGKVGETWTRGSGILHPSSLHPQRRWSYTSEAVRFSGK